MAKIDIFNDRYEHVGVEDKKVAHAKGLWHHTFSALAFNPSERTVYLQKKAPGRYSFDRPDYADVTVGGHIEAGESVRDGIREVREELGLDLAYDDLVPIGIRQTAVTLADTYIEREFQQWHLIPLQLGLDEFRFADSEVSGLVGLDIDDAIAISSGNVSEIGAHFAMRTDAGDVAYAEALVTTDDFVPNYLRLDRLYLRLFVAARRFMDGERELLFW